MFNCEEVSSWIIFWKKDYITFKKSRLVVFAFFYWYVLWEKPHQRLSDGLNILLYLHMYSVDSNSNSLPAKIGKTGEKDFETDGEGEPM